MFRSLQATNTPAITLHINGKAVSVPQGSSVWAAMALHHETTTRLSSISAKPRSAYCAMGVCFECLVNIDGRPNQQACLIEALEGMEICTQTITEESTYESEL